MIEISSGGVNPSNRGAGFPNLARSYMPSEERKRKFYPVDIEEVTATCRAELEAAGAMPYEFGSLLASVGEVPSRIVGTFGMWKFERRWYYWSADGPGIPIEIAEQLHAEHGSYLRVAGYAGGMCPRKWYKGFGVGDYHVDSPKGLKALVDALRTIYDPALDPEKSPRTGSA